MTPLTDRKSVLVACEQVGPFEYICRPRCRVSELMCKIAGLSYMTSEQVKIFEMLGFDFDITNTNQEVDYDSNRTGDDYPY